MFWALAVWALSAIFRTQRSAGFRRSLLGCLPAGLRLQIHKFLLSDSASSLGFYRSSRPTLVSESLALGRRISRSVLYFCRVFLWNEQQDWISFTQQFGRMNVHRVTVRYLGEFLAAQLGLLNPLIAYFAFVAIGIAFSKPIGHRSSSTVFLVSSQRRLSHT